MRAYLVTSQRLIKLLAPAMLMLAVLLFYSTNANAQCTTIGQDGSLAAHWKLDETSGTTAADSSGNSNNGTMLNGMNATNDSIAGVLGTSLDYDGIDDTIRVTDPGAGSIFFIAAMKLQYQRG
jgi:hypothetical protein